MLKLEEAIEELKRKYGVSSLKEFEHKISSGQIHANRPGDFSIEDDWLIWNDLEYKINHRSRS